MQRILVTGATGFVGGHVLEALEKDQKSQVIAACRERARLPRGFAGEVRVGDLRDGAYRRQLVEGVDVLCHCAAWTSAWGNASRSDELFLQPSLGLLDAAVEAGVKRFVFLSSTSVAAPYASQDPMSEARESHLQLWPHLRNVARIERAMRERAGQATGMVTLRVGLFAGERYGLGLLPMLVPRLRTHLVPWVRGGATSMPIVADRDIAQAFSRAATAADLDAYEAFNIVGPSVPSAREVIRFLHTEYGLPQPHFSVPFGLGYAFARLMEWMDPLVPWEPLVTRSIIHLLEETRADNQRARERLGYRPQIEWKHAVRRQMAEMRERQQRPMKMSMPIKPIS